MFFNRSFGPLELAFVLIFLSLYAFYVTRTFYLARRLHTTARSVVLKLILRSAAFGLLLLGLLEPSFGEAETEVRAVRRDVFLLVDVSKSMDATDVQPSRLEKVKFELSKLLDALPTDRFGLGIFSSGAFLQCPLTFDHSALRLFIESLDTRLVSAQGTAFGPALALAAEKLSREAPLGTGANPSKTILLISDGEDFGGDAGATVRVLRRNGIAVQTVGVGTGRGGRIRTSAGYLRDEAGEVVVTRLQPDRLRQLARDTGGMYVELTDRQNGFPALTERLAQLEGKVVDRRTQDVVANKYAYFLVVALVLLALDVLITVRTLRL